MTDRQSSNGPTLPQTTPMQVGTEVKKIENHWKRFVLIYVDVMSANRDRKSVVETYGAQAVKKIGAKETRMIRKIKEKFDKGPQDKITRVVPEWKNVPGKTQALGPLLPTKSNTRKEGAAKDPLMCDHMWDKIKFHGNKASSTAYCVDCHSRWERFDIPRLTNNIMPTDIMHGGQYAGLQYQEILAKDYTFCQKMVEIANAMPQLFEELKGGHATRFVAYLKLVQNQMQAPPQVQQHPGQPQIYPQTGVFQTQCQMPPTIAMDQEDSDKDPTPVPVPTVPTMNGDYELVAPLTARSLRAPQ